MTVAIAILATAAITPFGNDPGKLLERLEGGGIAEMGPHRIPEAVLAAAAGEAPSYRDRASTLLFAAANTALRNAGIPSPVPDPERFGLVTGSHRGPLDSYLLFERKFREAGPKLAPPLLFTHGFPNAPNTLLSIQHKIRGVNLTLSTGRASGLSALAHAAIQLEQGRANRILVAAFETVPEGFAVESACSEAAAAVLLARGSVPPGPQLESCGEEPRGARAPAGTRVGTSPLEPSFGDAAGALGLLGVVLAAERIRAGGMGPILVAAADEGGSAAAALVG